MELTNRHLEIIRKAVRSVEYGSVTINICATSKKLDLNIQNRIRYEDEPEEEKAIAETITNNVLKPSKTHEKGSTVHR